MLKLSPRFAAKRQAFAEQCNRPIELVETGGDDCQVIEQ